MHRRSSTLFIAGVATLVLGLSACTTPTTANESTSGPIDLKDAILTSMSGDCADYSASYQSNVSDVTRNLDFASTIDVSDDATTCTVTANDIPNYDFNDGTGHFATDVSAQSIALTIPRNPKPATSTTDLSLLTYNAVMLNGVVLDQVADGCYKPDDASADPDGNVAVGCGLWVDWRLNPLGKVDFGTDSHNAHTQPGGLYHYHGDPRALYDLTNNTVASPVIGFAADGFPIFGPYYLDETTGQVAQATSGYTVKAGERPAVTSSPGGSYDGTYIQDYEFTDAGTLDKCNGMTVNGQYGYYITTSYPYVMGCYTGTPNLTFFKFWEIAKWVIGGVVVVLGALVVLAIVLVRRRRRKRPLVLRLTRRRA